MEKFKFAIKDIKKYIEEKIGFEWKGDIIFNSNTGEYLKATLDSFNKKTAILYLNNPINKLNYLVKVEVSNDKFIIWNGKTKLDVSNDWRNMLLTETQGATL